MIKNLKIKQRTRYNIIGIIRAECFPEGSEPSAAPSVTSGPNLSYYFTVLEY